MKSTNLLQLRATMRLIAAASSVVLAMGAGSAFAQISVDGGNDTTGANSVNENTTDVDNDIDVDVDNTANIDDVVSFSANTGDNNTLNNTTVDGVEGGSIDAEIEFASEANSDAGVDASDLFGDDMDVSFDGDNDTTGANSENRNTLDVDNDFDLDIDNDADINTTVAISATTGSNDVRNNTTVDGDVRSGDIDIAISTDNQANNGAGQVNLGNLGGGDVDVNGGNGTTGFNSVNENTVDIDNDVDVDIDNGVFVN